MPKQLEVHELCALLVKACGALGLTAEAVSPTRVRAGVTNAGMLAEVVTCHLDDDGVLHWWWSWGSPFCRASAGEIDRAAEMILRVVTPYALA